MITQSEFRLQHLRRGGHLITGEILRHLPAPLPESGLLNIFVKHTSCGLTINENADPDVRHDLDKILDHIVPENQPYYYHTMEGLDDMPAHAKATLTDVSLTIPAVSYSPLRAHEP
ncbi:MAG: secondary thiamine-phosphate synthase enzyme YjbQ, partial [Muribaculaceae bacterium]|nr:secondary thiamine-phosphate synthase enzyme YjbQ [Muribaculaceae bacterium]